MTRLDDDMRYLEQEQMLFKLTFDAAFRKSFLLDRTNALASLSPESRATFTLVDGFGLTVDAEIRRDYLMSALGRSFALTCAAIGTLSDGPDRLVQFLASDAFLPKPFARAPAFSTFLSTLIDDESLGFAPRVVQLVRVFFELERARVDTAHALRMTIEKGDAVDKPRSFTSGEMKRGRVVLPPFLSVVVLPFPTGVMQNAFVGLDAAHVWHQIRLRQFRIERLETVAAARGMPVTVASRAVPAGQSAERDVAGGVLPLTDVAHTVVELRGMRGELFHSIDGKRTIALYPNSVQRLLRSLVEAGVLSLEL